MSNFELSALRQQLARYEEDANLLQPQRLADRLQALALTNLIEEIARSRRTQVDWLALRKDAEHLAQRCRTANQQQFERLRDELRSGQCSADQLRQQLDPFTAYQRGNDDFIHWGEEPIDVLIRGVLTSAPIPNPSQPLEAEMVHLEHTPSSVVLEMVDRVEITAQSHFFDIGAGLGQVAMLISLLTGAQSTGIEVDGAFCDYARQSAAALGLTGVRFVEQDAREADYRNGEIFFLFTPFRGAMLQTVLDRLWEAAQGQQVTICTYGPCTSTVAQQPWLHSLDHHVDHEFKLAIFTTVHA